MYKYKCISVCVLHMWHQFPNHVSILFSYSISHCACHFCGLSNGLPAPPWATASEIRWVGSSLEVAKCGRIIIVVIIILIILIIISIMIYLYLHFIFHNAVDGRHFVPSWYANYPTNYRVLCISTGAGSLPWSVFWWFIFWYVGDNLVPSSMTRLYILVPSCDKWLV